jgi:hypothetical protein
MAEGDSHGAVPQLPALRRRQLVHLRTVFLHDQRAGRLSFHDFPHHFHSMLIPPKRPGVNLADLSVSRLGLIFSYQSRTDGCTFRHRASLIYAQLATLDLVRAQIAMKQRKYSSKSLAVPRDELE